MNHNHTPQVEELIEGCKSNLQSSSKALYEMFKGSTFAICLRYADSREEAEDWLQEGWINIFRYIDKYDSSKGSFYTWASKVMVNNILVSKRKHKYYIEDIDSVINMPASQLMGYEEMEYKELIKVIQKLPNGFRTIFNMYEIEGYTHREIGQILGISESTSKTQLMRAKIALRETIAGLTNLNQTTLISYFERSL